jgi:riboflavin synthase
MFTGLIEEIGTVGEIVRSGEGAALRIDCTLAALVLGESIAVDGCCLTVARLAAGGFWCDASHETLAKTTLGAQSPGGRVHLERAIRAGDRMGGHVVTGHVDGVGRLVSRRAVGTAFEVTFEVPPALAPHLAPKGCVALDGTSLTINTVTGPRLDVVLIPYTLEHTTFGSRPDGTPVNVETDILAKYVERMLASRTGG